MINKIADAHIDTLFGKARLVAYKNKVSKKSTPLYCFALVFGAVSGKNDVFCRVHSSCITAESFFATNCDCREQLINAFKICQKQGGIIIYLPQEGRGSGIEAKLKQIELEGKIGIDTITAFVMAGYPPDNRTYEEAAAIIKNLHIKSIHLYTDSPYKERGLIKYGIRITKRIHLQVTVKNSQAKKNIKAKQKYLHYYDS